MHRNQDLLLGIIVSESLLAPEKGKVRVTVKVKVVQWKMAPRSSFCPESDRRPGQ